jgi:hypothetical protein
MTLRREVDGERPDLSRMRLDGPVIGRLLSGLRGLVGGLRGPPPHSGGLVWRELAGWRLRASG